MFINFKNGRVAAMAFAGFLVASAGQPAWAGKTTIDFNGTGANVSEGKTTVTAGVFEIKGGKVIDKAGNYGKVYVSNRPVLIRSTDGSVITSVAVTVTNPGDADANPHGVPKEFKWSLGDALNSRTEYFNRDDWTLGAGDTRVVTTVTTPVDGFKVAVLSMQSGSRDYYISKIVINTGPPTTKFSVRAFIPGEHAPAGPNMFCIAVPETTTDGVTRAPTVVRGASASVESAERRPLHVVGGDFGDGGYEAFQAVSVNTSDGTVVDPVNDAGLFNMFADNALSGGRVVGDVFDNRTDDCDKFHDVYEPGNGSMDVTVSTDTDGNTVVNLVGSVDTPFAGSKGNDSIDWDVTVTLDDEGNATVSGAHDGFPAFEIAVDDTVVYESGDPANGGKYTFERHVRKLMQPMVPIR